MIAYAKARFIRISPRKFRQIIPFVKGRRAEEAMAVLMSVKKRASQYTIELLKSAIANAKRIRQDINPANLYVSNIVVDCGPSLKRFRAASMGRASPILKRTSHITLEVDEITAKGASGTARTQHKAAAREKGHPEQGGKAQKAPPKKAAEEKIKEKSKKQKTTK
ncbi:MAG: 50S ribosomal protein L22 [Candidatus Omnitrophota bacterium]